MLEQMCSGPAVAGIDGPTVSFGIRRIRAGSSPSDDDGPSDDLKEVGDLPDELRRTLNVSL